MYHRVLYSLVPRRGRRNAWYTLFAHARNFEVDDVVMWVGLHLLCHERTMASGVQNGRVADETSSVARRSLSMPPSLEVTILHSMLLPLKLVT